MRTETSATITRRPFIHNYQIVSALERANTARVARGEQPEPIIYVRLTTPAGGAEHRPIIRFDPAAPAGYYQPGTDLPEPLDAYLYVRRSDVAKTTYLPLHPDLAGPATVALPPASIVIAPAPVAPVEQPAAAPVALLTYTPSADVAPDVISADTVAPAPVATPVLYKRIIFKNRARHIELAAGEPIPDTVYVRHGAGKSTRYETYPYAIPAV